MSFFRREKIIAPFEYPDYEKLYQCLTKCDFTKRIA